MNKEELEVKIESLREMVLGSQQSTSNYTGQLVEMEKRLEDLNKPKVTSLFLDTISEVITEAIENLDLEDGVACDFEIGYDNKVEMSDVRFDDVQQVADKIYRAVEKLFAEIREKEDK